MADKKKLPKGISFVPKRSLYRWRFRYDGKDYVGYCKTLKQAEKELSDKRYEVEHGMYCKEESITFDKWFNTWIDTYKTNCKESTLHQYKETYKRYIEPEFGKRKLKLLRPEHLQTFANKMAGKYSATVFRECNFLLYDAMQQAVKNRIINRNPMEYVTMPKTKERKKKGALSADQQQAFLKEAESCEYYRLFKLSTLTGMRIGEIIGLQWSDVDFKNREIHVTHTMSYIPKKGQYLDKPKSKASLRTIPMIESAYTLLSKQRKDQMKLMLQLGQYWAPATGMGNLVFTSKNGTGIYDTNIRTAMRRICDKLNDQGIDRYNCTFHTLRHCFATRCIENGMEPKTLQTILGHTTLAMTMDLYCDVMEQTKKEAMHKIANAL